MKRRRIHIAVVGNGPVDPAVRFDIDAHHLVVRFNSCQNYGSSGWRTDILVIVNTGPQGQRLAYEPGAINAEALVSAKSSGFPTPARFNRNRNAGLKGALIMVELHTRHRSATP